MALQEASEPASSLPDIQAQVSRPSTIELSPVESAAVSSDPDKHVPVGEISSRNSADATEDYTGGEELPLVTQSQVTPSAQNSMDQLKEDLI